MLQIFYSAEPTCFLGSLMRLFPTWSDVEFLRVRKIAQINLMLAEKTFLCSLPLIISVEVCYFNASRAGKKTDPLYTLS